VVFARVVARICFRNERVESSSAGDWRRVRHIERVRSKNYQVAKRECLMKNEETQEC